MRCVLRPVHWLCGTASFIIISGKAPSCSMPAFSHILCACRCWLQIELNWLCMCMCIMQPVDAIAVGPPCPGRCANAHHVITCTSQSDSTTHRWLFSCFCANLLMRHWISGSAYRTGSAHRTCIYLYRCTVRCNVMTTLLDAGRVLATQCIAPHGVGSAVACTPLFQAILSRNVLHTCNMDPLL